MTHEAPGRGDLCTSGWIHVYDDPLLAVLHAPIHVSDFNGYRLWECECSGETKADEQMKRGVQRCTTVREIPLPEVTTRQRVRYGILCAMEVCLDKAWRTWAEKWLSGENRTSADAASAARAAGAEAERAAADAAEAAWAAADAAEAAWAAARAAARAARAAARAGKSLDLIAIARKAIARKAIARKAMEGV